MKKPHNIKKEQMFYIETAKQKVMELFYKFPEKEFSLSDIAKEARVAKANLGVILASLDSIEFIKIEKLAKIWRVKANQENWMFKRAKIVYNLNFIYQSGLIDFLNDSYNNPKAIILFGSFRKGEDTSKSDIDIAIESDEFKEYKTVELKQLSDLEKAIGRAIQIHEFNRKHVDINVFNNIANGIILYGFLEVKI
ncbi:nucleotidyltransferase domain-containing protein [Candidatus Pacearchaeota archaeon]|nr:nucleotidyltransferase domain-containing protein [Candidatus Pacearchaeota archaeon]